MPYPECHHTMELMFTPELKSFDMLFDSLVSKVSNLETQNAFLTEVFQKYVTQERSNLLERILQANKTMVNNAQKVDHVHSRLDYMRVNE